MKKLSDRHDSFLVGRLLMRKFGDDKMRKQKRRLKSRRGNKYPTKVILVASAVCWIAALIFWLCF